MNNVFEVIGLMSGTSLDGLDIAFCRFEKRDQWIYNIIEAETIKYSDAWKETLVKAHSVSGLELTEIDHTFGKFMGQEVKKFISKYKIQPDLIASHGHTIFHQPEKGFTLQIGSGADIYSITGVPVINDFRSLDVALGGQGAPLVPIGDELLFADYTFCLNLGGIANISFNNNKRLAYDICACNFVLNYLSDKLGYEYDPGGKFAKSGNVLPSLLKTLDELPFYRQAFPKSLGREWIEKSVFPLLHEPSSTEDKLATFTQHIANKINETVLNNLTVINKGKTGITVFTTGGGAFNTYLLELLQKGAPGEINYIVPDGKIVAFKEALIFAFLGVLRARKEINCLQAVTGALRSSSGGMIYGDI